MRAYLGDLEFVGDDATATYTLANLVGWFEGVDADGDQDQRSGADGVFDSPGFLGGRLITVSGLLFGHGSGVAFENAITALASIPVRDLTVFTVESVTGTTWASVRRLDKPDVRIDAFGYTASYQLRLFAPDPFRYGAAQSVGPGASLEVSHAGTADAVPTVTVEGPQAAPYTVASQGHAVTVTQALASGETHTIDMATGWVYLDGDLQAGVVSAVDVFTIPPGGPVTVTGPASMTVDVTDTYE